ncbi:hypothetical protein INS49_014228 [Diaporthe citri]|uniref:uncharacterized protein n=1 Tax=Diaporthe citri TaxID=83186 RepID=UPI001C81EC5A|nr:uncharacterized protein INS49_014228 [Diaporthe citri]KAG6358344.1 hypothetical protein INS49_014228 [Diaporthe citri]
MAFTNLVRFRDEHGQVLYGDAPEDILDSLVGGVVHVLAGDPFQGGVERTGQKATIKEVLCPLESSPSIPCIGMNYLAHVKETPHQVPVCPVVFVKPEDCLAGPFDNIEVSPCAMELDWEAELCLIIGKDCKDVSPEEAPEYILGYTAGNDLSARHWQRLPYSASLDPPIMNKPEETNGKSSDVDFEAYGDKALSPSALAHVVLRTAKLKEMEKFYVDFLGGRVVHSTSLFSFITYDYEHHRIALIGRPGTGPKISSSSGLEHIAFTFPTLADLLLSYRQRKAKGMLPMWCVNHGPSTSIYYLDPDGNRVETQVDNYPTAEEADAFMKSSYFINNPIGTDFDPEELIVKVKNGVPDAVLKKREEIGPRDPPLGRAGIYVDIIEREFGLSTIPRACGTYGGPLDVLNELGLYQKATERGHMSRGICWRGKPQDDGRGGKQLGPLVAALPLCAPDDEAIPVGAGCLNLPQAELNNLFLQEALETERVKIHYSTEFSSMVCNGPEGVIINAHDSRNGAEKQFQGDYLVAADGARSGVRRALGLPWVGHTWPERLIATDVLLKNHELSPWETHFTMAPVHYAVTTPLEAPVAGGFSLWRHSVACSPSDERPDDELLADENILRHYESNIAGPRPLQVQIKNRAVYRIHQRLASTLRKGNCVLAGDAGHANNPIGAMGLSTGMLDADALGEALVMVLNEGYPDDILDLYSDERRKVFQYFVNPVTTENKLRLQSQPAEAAVQQDWFLRMLARGMTMDEAMEFQKAYSVSWRTNMREAAKEFRPKANGHV